MRFVVTGGAGFIGSHLSDVLVKKGDVVVFDNFSSGKKDFLRDMRVEIIQGDIRNLGEIREACKDVDMVYHYAADPDVRRSFSKPLENFAMDALGTVNVLEACICLLLSRLRQCRNTNLRRSTRSSCQQLWRC
jgi:UDP-glucose 4-epimerase